MNELLRPIPSNPLLGLGENVPLLAVLMVVLFGIPAALGLIPASVAKSKGRSFGHWWL